MRLENHTEIFSLDKRFRGIGDISFGNGVSYVTLGWSAIGIILTAPVTLTFFIVGGAIFGFLLGLLLAAGTMAAAAFITPRIARRKTGDGRSGFEKALSAVMYRFGAKTYVSGIAYRPDSGRVDVTAASG